MRTLLSTLASVFILLFALNNQTLAQTSSLYDFNTPNELAENFNQTSNSTNISQSTNTGIGGTGAINVTSGSTNDVFTTQEGYSLGVTGSEYVFESYIKSVWNSGYSGLGFTNNSPAIASGSFPYRPNIGLGISVHGGGYVFHNNGENFFGSWASGAPAGVTVVKHATIFDLLNNGSPDDWYRVVFTINRVSPTTYDMRVEIWSAMADGTLINPNEADAIMEMNGIENADITGSDILYSYFSFSGSRVSDFDNYSINLAGGATVVEAGAPVVFTNSSSFDNNVITVNGNAANDNGSVITDRGIVYATTTEPDLNDNVVQSGSGTGEFTASTPSLSGGTYYARTYAVNEVGTSYGSEVTYVVETPEVLGCTDPEACNFVAEATDDDGSCTYPEEDYLDCEGNCINDADDDGVCDEVEVVGCMDESACNFNPEATDADWSLCEYPEPGLDCEGNCLYPELDIDYLTSQIWYDGPADCESGELLDTFNDTYVVFNADGTVTTFDGESDEELWSANWTTNDCVVIIDDFFFMWQVGENYVGEGKGCWGFTPAPQGCTDETACNFDPEADFDNDSCTYPTEDYFDCEGNCLNDADEDGVCDEIEVPGCTDESACNFVAEATDEDGSCTYAETGFDCEGNCLTEGFALIDLTNTFWLVGPVDCETGEYLAEESNVVVDFLPSGYYQVLYPNGESEFGTWSSNGCTVTFDDEYTMSVNGDGFSGYDIECISMLPLESGCTDVNACNYDAEAEFDDSSCTYPVEDYLDCDGNCLNDADQDGVCDELEVPGCTDESACNFVAEATDDDDSCEYAEDFYDCDGNCLSDIDEDGVCDELEIEGCTNPAACNYDPEATEEDGSCLVLTAQNINGPDEVIAYQTVSYTYPQAGPTTIEWGIENGTIVSGQGTGVVEVVWDEMFYGAIWCQEFSGDCPGPVAEMQVDILGVINSVEEGEALSMNLYPNPSNGQITVDPGTLKDVAQLEIFDAAGRIVHQAGITGKTVLQLNHLAGGNYVVKLITNENIITERLVIQH